MLKRLLGLLILAAILAGALFLRQGRHEPFRVSGFIEADEIRVGSRVGGRVRTVNAAEGMAVRRGDPLVELEPYDLNERHRQAKAELAARQADLSRLTSGYRAEEIGQAKARRDQLAAALELLLAGPRAEDIAAAQAQLDLAKAQLELAKSEFSRAEVLVKRGVASKEEHDQANSRLRVADQTEKTRQQELVKLQRGARAEEISEARARLDEADQAWRLQVKGYRTEDVEQAKAAVEAASAGVAAVERQLEELVIKAPADGLIEAVELQPGDLVAANAPVLSMMDVSRLWIRAYTPENRPVEVGQEVRITVDAFPNETFNGRISFVSRQAEFTPGNVQTPEERSKQVFRIKVELEADVKRLRPGMAGDVWFDLNRPAHE